MFELKPYQCTKCKNYFISITDKPCKDCQKVFRQTREKPNFISNQTNFDRFKAMSVEELADWMNYNCDAYYEPDCGWLDWLKQEVEE